MKPIVSIVVPTRFRVRYLQEAIHSIQRQTFSNFELLVVADGHQPEVQEYIDKLEDPRVVYILAEFSGHPGRTRNVGLRKSVGEFIAFCDDDDMWATDKLQLQISKMRSQALQFTFTAAIAMDEDGLEIDGSRLHVPVRITQLRYLLSLSSVIVTSSVVLKRDLLMSVGEFNQSDALRTGEDYELFTRILARTDAVSLQEPLIRYRIHRASIQPRTVASWFAEQKGLQRALLRTASAPHWAWYLRYLRVYYWAGRLMICGMKSRLGRARG